MNDHEECYAACKQVSGCKFFTFRTGNECVLIKEKAQSDPHQRGQNSGIVSGSIQECSKGRKFFILLAVLYEI